MTAGELLSSFRGAGATSPGAAKTAASAEGYVACKGKDKPLFLDIRPVHPPAHSPSYNCLLNVMHDKEMGTYLFIKFTFMIVRVKGRNLQEVVFAIQQRMAGVIQEFDPTKWPPPPNDKAPFIESIEIEI